MSDEIETIPVELAEIKQGISLKPGHPVVLVVAGVKGTRLPVRRAADPGGKRPSAAPDHAPPPPPVTPRPPKQPRRGDEVTDEPPLAYSIGVGKADVTDYAVGLPMQGMSDPFQKVAGVESPLWARAFVIESASSRERVALVVVDIWACTIAIKRAVIERLSREVPGAFDDAHVWIAGTHTHSGPGGFSHHFLYNASGGGFDDHNFETIVHGIVAAIRQARAGLAPGRVLVNAGAVPDCGRNRSLPAYLKNPQAERDRHGDTIEKEMLLLKFLRKDGPGEIAIGMLCWYGVHPTDRGQGNSLVSGDNKGYAAQLFEEDQGGQARPFVAAFANASAGDVSGNLEFGQRPDGVHDREHMIVHARRQKEAAVQIFRAASEPLSGPIAVRHRYLDMPARTGVPGALGTSMFAGSSEDSEGGPGMFHEGMVVNMGDLDNPSVYLFNMGMITTMLNLPLLANVASNFVTRGTVPTATVPTGFDATHAERAGHFPKPIAALPGRATPDPITPNVLPAQLIQVGQFALIGLPMEITTMAGRRLRRTVLEAIGPGVSRVALGSYANGYAQYVTTPEEYTAQHYEGASTIFGPRQLEVLQGAFGELAGGLRDGTPVPSDGAPPDFSSRVLRKPRITVRNLGDQPVRIRVFAPHDTTWAVPQILYGSDVVLPPHGERAYVMPVQGLIEGILQFVSGDQRLGLFLPPPVHRVIASIGQLVTVHPDGSLRAGEYTPRTTPGPLASAGAAPAASLVPQLRIENRARHDVFVRIFSPADQAFLAALPGGEFKVSAGGTASWPIPPGLRQVRVTFDDRDPRTVPVDAPLIIERDAWITIDNATASRVVVRFYRVDDGVRLATLRDGTQVLPPGGSLSWLPPFELQAVMATFDRGHPRRIAPGEVISYAPQTHASAAPPPGVAVENRAPRRVVVRFYDRNDGAMWIPLPGGERAVDAGTRLTWDLPGGRNEVKVTFDGTRPNLAAAGQQLILNANGSVSR